MADLGDEALGTQSTSPFLILGKKKKESQKEEKPAVQATENLPLPPFLPLDPPLMRVYLLNTFLVFALVNFSGTAGDSFSYHRGWPFSTPDEENDFKPTGNCALEYHGGWWFKWCHKAFLNGPYMHGRNPDHGEGNIWEHFRGVRYSLKSSQMKIRPRDF